MSKDKSGPAFPTSVNNTSGKDLKGFTGDVVGAGTQTNYMGLSIREYAAIKAMQGLLANGEALTFLDEYVKATTGKSLDSAVSEVAVSYADALLAELRK